MLCTTKGALHRRAVGVQPSPAQRLARDQRVEPVGLHPSAGGLALDGRAAPLGRAALRVRPGEPPSCQEPKIGAGAYRRVDAVAAEAAALAVAIAERRLELTAGAPGAGAGPGSGAPTRRCARKAALSPGLRTTHIRFRVRVTAVVSAGAHEKPAQDENRKLHPPAIRVSLSHGCDTLAGRSRRASAPLSLLPPPSAIGPGAKQKPASYDQGDGGRVLQPHVCGSGARCRSHAWSGSAAAVLIRRQSTAPPHGKRERGSPDAACHGTHEWRCGSRVPCARE
jgi:hypothetical protein